MGRKARVKYPYSCPVERSRKIFEDKTYCQQLPVHRTKASYTEHLEELRSRGYNARMVKLKPPKGKPKDYYIRPFLVYARKAK